MTRMVLVGQAPNRTGDPDAPCMGKIMRRITKLTEVSERDYLARFERRNLLDVFPGKNGKGDAFPFAEARRRAEKLSGEFEGRLIVCLGKQVARAFGARVGWFKIVEANGLRLCVIPHPSGVNRWWNDEANRCEAVAFLKRLLKTFSVVEDGKNGKTA